MSQQLRVFLAIPYRDEFTWIQNSIAAACRKLNVDLIRVDEKIVPGTSIVTAIHHFIQESDFAFVVLTGVNSNVVYELGLLHAGSKPTILLTDKKTADQLPFDLRTFTVIRYDSEKKDESELTMVCTAAGGRVISLMTDSVIRSEMTQGRSSFQFNSPPSAELSIGAIDWMDIVKKAQGAMGLKNCQQRNLSQFDDPVTPGWKLKAKCAGGSSLEVVVDLNGEIREIDVQ